MKVLDPGHVYELRPLPSRPCAQDPDPSVGPGRCAEHGRTNVDPQTGLCAVAARPQVLTFVKREGPGYPGNVGSYPGTTTQEVLRALVDRTRYVDSQEPSTTNQEVLACLRRALVLLEQRAATRANRKLPNDFDGHLYPERFRTCPTCGHVGCAGGCR